MKPVYQSYLFQEFIAVAIPAEIPGTWEIHFDDECAEASIISFFTTERAIN